MCMFGIKICKQILPKIGLADGETKAYFSKKKPKHFGHNTLHVTLRACLKSNFASKSGTCACVELDFASKSGTCACL